MVSLQTPLANASGPTVGVIERRRLVRAIDACTHGHLVHAGRRYRLAADIDLAKIPGCVEYAVLPQTLARRILTELAGEGRMPDDLASLLVQARSRLSHDWCAPLSRPDGLVLLRKDLRPRRVRPIRQDIRTVQVHR